jgi:hypothetical protein
MQKAEAAKADRFARHMAPGAHSVDETVVYVLLILAHHGEAPGDATLSACQKRIGFTQSSLPDNKYYGNDLCPSSYPQR